jgi:hypothetical protein
VQAAVNAEKMLAQLRFRVAFDEKHTIEVVIRDYRPVRNTVCPDLSILVFSLSRVVGTPGNEHIPGVFFVTQAGFEVGRASWAENITDTKLVDRGVIFTQDTTQRVLFGAATESAAAWFLQKLAQAQGKRFRSHGLLTPDGGRWKYTITP